MIKRCCTFEIERIETIDFGKGLSMNIHKDRVIIIGAGPAGIACAFALGSKGKPSLVIERDEEAGGLCRTIDYSGYLFDIGGHRFLSKSDVINRLWNETLGDELLKVQRLSRIYYKKKLFKYPLSFLNTFWNLGMIESFRCIVSYMYCKLVRPGDDKTFEGWITNRFGKRLYDIFFNTYTMKVWDVPCKDISADWAVQRIRGLSLRVAMKKALLGTKIRNTKAIYEEFYYPRKGPGQFYKKFKELTTQLGTQFLCNNKVTCIKHDGQRMYSIMVKDDQENTESEIEIDYLFSSIPLPIFVRSMLPSPPSDVLFAAERLRFRSFLIVNVIIDKENLFPDQWIYVHSPEVRLARIQNYKNWSPDMTADPKRTSLGLEYFCTEGDDLWQMNDVDLIDYAVKELERIGIKSRKRLINGFVIRKANCYPIYSLEYQKHLRVIQDYLRQFLNFQTIGRAGLFRYDNSDQAMLSGILAAKNYLENSFVDLWGSGAEQEYLEM